MINYDRREMEPRTLKEHNVRVLIADDIMTGKEFRRMIRKDKKKTKLVFN